MAEKLLQINFGVNVAPAEYDAICLSVADAFAAIPGLRWKLWFQDAGRRDAGGIYLFEDQRALDAFLGSDLAKTVATHPALRDVTVRPSDVMPALSAITRAPIAASVRA